MDKITEPFFSIDPDRLASPEDLKTRSFDPDPPENGKKNHNEHSLKANVKREVAHVLNVLQTKSEEKKAAGQKIPRNKPEKKRKSADNRNIIDSIYNGLFRKIKTTESWTELDTRDRENFLINLDNVLLNSSEDGESSLMRRSAALVKQTVIKFPEAAGILGRSLNGVDGESGQLIDAAERLRDYLWDTPKISALRSDVQAEIYTDFGTLLIGISKTTNPSSRVSLAEKLCTNYFANHQELQKALAISKKVS